MALHCTLKYKIIIFSGLVGIYYLFITMLLLLLLIIPLIGIFIISTSTYDELSTVHVKRVKYIALATSVFNLFISLIIFRYICFIYIFCYINYYYNTYFIIIKLNIYIRKY